MASPAAAVNRLAEGLEPGKHRPYRRGSFPAGAQIHVPDGAAFTRIDRFPGGETGFPAIEIGGPGQIEEGREDFGRDPLLGKVQDQAVYPAGKAGKAVRVRREEFAQVATPAVRREGFQGRRSGDHDIALALGCIGMIDEMLRNVFINSAGLRINTRDLAVLFLQMWYRIFLKRDAEVAHVRAVGARRPLVLRNG